MQLKIEKKNRAVRFYGVKDPRGLSEHYQDIVNKLLDGDYEGLSVEKLRNQVCSVRVNHSARLLFTAITVKGEPYLMLLDEVLHDYSRSSILKPAMLKHYLELYGGVISEELNRLYFERDKTNTFKFGSKPYSPKIYVYLNSFLKDVSMANITNLLNNSKAKEYLFDYPMEDGTCLFTRFFYEKSSRETFLSCLPRYAKTLAGWIGEHALCRHRMSVKGEFENPSPLYWLAMQPQLLEIFLTGNPRLARGALMKALCLACPEDSGDTANISPLYTLSTTNAGRELLGNLFAANPELVRYMSAEALCRSLGDNTDKMSNMSPLYCLSFTSSGLKVLKALFLGNPELLYSVTADALCLRLPVCTGLNANASPLYWLSTTSEGRAILKLLFIYNPKLAYSISAEDLCTTYHKSGYSPLSQILSAPDGRDIIKHLSVNMDLDRLFQDNPRRSPLYQASIFAKLPVSSSSDDDSIQPENNRP